MVRLLRLIFKPADTVSTADDCYRDHKIGSIIVLLVVVGRIMLGNPSLNEKLLWFSCLAYEFIKSQLFAGISYMQSDLTDLQKATETLNQEVKKLHDAKIKRPSIPF